MDGITPIYIFILLLLLINLISANAIAYVFFYIAYYHLGLCCSTSLSSKLHSVIFTLLPINGYFADAQENSCSEQKLHSV